MATEKIDMSLDDIIKLNKKEQRKQQGQQTARGGKVVRQFRGRVGGKAVRGRGGTVGRGAGRGRGGAAVNRVGVSPLNRQSKQKMRGGARLKRQQNLQGQGSAGSKRGQQQSKRGRGNRINTRGRQQSMRGQGRATVVNMSQTRQRANNRVKAAIKQQNQRQRQNRQNLINQQRGLQIQPQKRGRKKTGDLRSDQLISQQTQQKKRRWGRTNLQRSDSVMTISFENDPSKKQNSDVQLSMGGRNRRGRLQRQRSNSNVNSAPVLVQSGQSQQMLTSSVNVSRGQRSRRRLKRNSLQTPIASPQEDFEVLMPQTQAVRGQGQRRRGRGGNQGTRGRRKSNQGAAPAVQAASALQMQLKMLQPTVKTEYKFQRQDFGKASTKMSLSDRFSRNISYQAPGKNMNNAVQGPGGRQVFF